MIGKITNKQDLMAIIDSLVERARDQDGGGAAIFEFGDGRKFMVQVVASPKDGGLRGLMTTAGLNLLKTMAKVAESESEEQPPAQTAPAQTAPQVETIVANAGPDDDDDEEESDSGECPCENCQAARLAAYAALGRPN